MKRHRRIYAIRLWRRIVGYRVMWENERGEQREEFYLTRERPSGEGPYR